MLGSLGLLHVYEPVFFLCFMCQYMDEYDQDSPLFRLIFRYVVSQERQRIVASVRQSRVQELRIEAEEAGTC